MDILKVEHLTKIYGSGENAVKALDDVSFTVSRGEFAAIVGESGSGKSTLLNCIGALDQPSGGKVYLNNTDIFCHVREKADYFPPSQHWIRLPVFSSGAGAHRGTKYHLSPAS